MTDTNLSLTDISFSVSYTKTQKLITALYMVTDIIETEEPIRHKLRTLGAEVVSDMHSVPAQASSKIAEIMSFLNIASAMNFISEMNCAILKKEFVELKGSIQEHLNTKTSWLTEFFPANQSIGHEEAYKGQQKRARIGVQKGSTLMNALSDRNLVRSLGGSATFQHQENKSGVSSSLSRTQDFNIIKKQRRDNIITIIKNNEGGATIKDIRTKINLGVPSSLVCSEKTLQRELMSMTKDGVLYKTGEKRWSKYFIK